ncbi:hypothetical protein GCM10020358_46850 [Amorphoplanes nipponensis]|uniref:Uncharacterized protein n=1 Tax=Actinoplanes nipponensis TaxID=135950 RepID=A0A919JGT9_9ACTN|nr:DUF6023 family protein [Actinoplanes nipponensis]GIE49388.1 hypothetical protein Ani05nite_29220 [Actinoplanes nipponensis]
MRGDRAAGVMLYALALVLLAGGVVWFVRAAPDVGEDPAVVAGRVTVERLLPDLPRQAQAETMVLAAGRRTERSTAVVGGSYSLVMLCVGDGQVRVRLSAVGTDSGRAVPCAADEPQPVELTVGLADDFFMAVSAETRGAAVFRWRVTRARSY